MFHLNELTQYQLHFSCYKNMDFKSHFILLELLKFYLFQFYKITIKLRSYKKFIDAYFFIC